jgi:DnaJ-domain-containing protein 1
LFAPHILVSATHALYSDKDFIIPAPKVGIAASREDADYLKATAFYLNSSVARYAHFFHNPTWGISIDRVGPEPVGAIPFTRLSAEQVRKLARAYDELASKEQTYLAEYTPLQGVPLDLQNEVDEKVDAVLKIPKSLSVLAREFMQVRYQLSKGKLGDTAIEPPTADQLKEYGEQLRSQIDDFARRHHQITIQPGQEAIIATVEVTSELNTLPVVVSRKQNSVAKEVLQAVKEQHSQWAYVQRSVRFFDGPNVHIIKTARLLDWTRTQAVQDAADLISEVLDKTEPHYESAAS